MAQKTCTPPFTALLKLSIMKTMSFLPLCILRGQGQWLEYGEGQLKCVLTEKARKKEEKGERKLISFFIPDPIFTLLPCGLLWDPPTGHVATLQ